MGDNELPLTWFFRGLLLLDAASIPALLVADGLRPGGGGEGDWLRDQGADYSFSTSALDIAIAALVRGAVLLPVAWPPSVLASDAAAALSLNAPAPASAPEARPSAAAVRPPRRGVALAAALVLAASAALGAAKVHAAAGGHLHGDARIGWAMVVLALASPLLEAGALALQAPSWRRAYSKLPDSDPLPGPEEGEEPGEAARRATLRRVLRLAGPEKGLLALGLLALLVSSMALLTVPYLFGVVIDAMKDNTDKDHARHTLSRAIARLILASVVLSVAAFARNWVFTLAGQRLLARISRQLFASIMSQDTAFFDATRTGELTNRLSSDCTAIQNSLTVNLSMLGRFLAQIIGSLAVMFTLSPRLTGVMLSVVPVVVAAAAAYGAFIKRVRRQYQDALAAASAIAEESVSGVRTLRALHGEPHAAAQYSARVDRSLFHGKRLALAGGGFVGFVGLIAQASVTLALWYGGTLVIDGHLSAGRLTSFLLYTVTVSAGFSVLSSLYGSFMEAAGASVRVFELLDREPALQPGRQVPREDEEEGCAELVRFDDVSFSYPSRPGEAVLSGVSFALPRGSVTALVGPSGGGKSTIVALIERFYDPCRGTVRVAGLDARDVAPEWLHSRVALVAQEPVLFACSVADNIRMGCRTASDEQVREAARRANAADFIGGFEEGYDTLVGERGVRLSGGQKQRIAIARALVADPALLLLDEATSALDAESEHLVQEAIDRAMAGRTVLVIAHRLSTVRSAREVLVVDGGRIAERGTHEQLLQEKGIYSALVRRQMLGPAAAP